jgi:hypothetical protein
LADMFTKILGVMKLKKFAQRILYQTCAFLKYCPVLGDYLKVTATCRLSLSLSLSGTNVILLLLLLSIGVWIISVQSHTKNI